VATVMRSACNVCGRETDHNVLHLEEDAQHGDAGTLETKRYALSCRGCHDTSFRTEEFWFELPVEEEVTPTVSFQPQGFGEDHPSGSTSLKAWIWT
jgi:hypothetical protein